MLEENSEGESLFSDDSFVIMPTEQADIKKRIEKVGTPLSEWDISIYRGVLTGFNKAFIIDGTKKDELIAENPKSAEIIKPILRGKDIKRYKAEFADLWLINSHNGYDSVPSINIDDYPAVKKHLDNYWVDIEKRYDKGITPYNLRNCVYVEAFEKEKIIFQEMVQESSFVYDQYNKYYCNDTGRIITGEKIKFLTAIFNSKLFFYSVKTFYGGGALGQNGIRMKHTFFENFPIPKTSHNQQLPFEILVDCILFAKENNMETEAETFESVIDGMVYDLYFEEEMKKANCYITDRIREVVKLFKEDDSYEFKKEYIEKLYAFCRNDKIVFRGLIHRRNVKVVKIINGEKE